MYIAQFDGKSLPSRIIKKINWTDPKHPTSHSAFYFPKCPVNTCWEACWKPFKRGKKVGWFPSLSTNHTEGTRVDLYRLVPELTPFEMNSLFMWLDREDGKKYDWRGCFYFITRPAKIEGDKDWFCSEAIFSAFLSIGRRLLNNIPPHKVSPTVLLYPTSLQYEKTIYTE